MENLCALWLSILVVFIATLSKICDGVDQERKVHIVYMGALPKGEYSPSSHHVSLLQEVVGQSFARESLVRSYTRSFNGFAAYLNEKERQKLASFEGVVSVFPSRTLQLQTTRSWDFMGFPETVGRNPTIESNVIVGLIDTGIWPELQSFSDEGLGPVPSKWKGACNGGANFTCNKKIIGARWYSFLREDPFTRDIIGHGSHTGSIVAGNNVNNASFYGIAQGTARGGVPSARIAGYKVCHPISKCYEADILAAFDDAIADGVDIISIAIGGGSAVNFSSDSISIGSFHAMERGILTVNAAGNDALYGIPTASVAPWMLSVAASNIDRRIADKLVLGNGTTLIGNAVNAFHLGGGEYPLIYGEEASRFAHGCLADYTQRCNPGCLISEKVKGKIVVCHDTADIKEAHRAGAIGCIVENSKTEFSSVVPIPATLLSNQETHSLNAYMNSTKSPKANISASETLHILDAPTVALFSQRGPNLIAPEILKPDITAPGVEILGSFSPIALVTPDPLDLRSVKYNILTGTSMSCSHAAGAAAYVKSFHPDWSPSAIKSALMTTAFKMNATKNSEAEFAYGAGHIDPVKAINPGLVYEASVDDYINMLCSMNYDIPALGKISGGNITCPKGVKMTPRDLNYPSMTVQVGDKSSSFVVKLQRTVTNVGVANSTYKATITQNSQLNITVEPSILSFESLNEKKSFAVNVAGAGLKSGLESAALVWSDGPYSVRSPIVVFF